MKINWKFVLVLVVMLLITLAVVCMEGYKLNKPKKILEVLEVKWGESPRWGWGDGGTVECVITNYGRERGVFIRLYDCRNYQDFSRGYFLLKEGNNSVFLGYGGTSIKLNRLKVIIDNQVVWGEGQVEYQEPNEGFEVTSIVFRNFTKLAQETIYGYQFIYSIEYHGYNYGEGCWKEFYEECIRAGNGRTIKVFLKEGENVIYSTSEYTIKELWNEDLIEFTEHEDLEFTRGRIGFWYNQEKERNEGIFVLKNIGQTEIEIAQIRMPLHETCFGYEVESVLVDWSNIQGERKIKPNDESEFVILGGGSYSQSPLKARVIVTTSRNNSFISLESYRLSVKRSRYPVNIQVIRVEIGSNEYYSDGIIRTNIYFHIEGYDEEMRPKFSFYNKKEDKWGIWNTYVAEVHWDGSWSSWSDPYRSGGVPFTHVIEFESCPITEELNLNDYVLIGDWQIIWDGKIYK